MKTILISILLILALAIPVTVSAAPETQSCYGVMLTEVLPGDTWQSIAKHWQVDVRTLKDMNRNTPQIRRQPVPGVFLRVPVFIGCPRPG